MEEATRGCVGELEDTRKEETPWHFMEAIMVEQLIKTMFLGYQSLMVVILVCMFGLLLLVLAKDITVILIVLVLLMEDIVPLLMLAITITANQVQCIVLILPHISSMTHYGMEQDVWTIVVMTPLNLGSIVS